jgi:hypothetical protein
MSMCSSYQSLICLIRATCNVGVRELLPTGIVNAQIMESESRSITISNMLYSCDLFQATDARDIIFGIQGLCNVENGSLITTDYDEKPEARVYIDAAVYLLGQETPLRLLSHAGIGNYLEPRKIVDLPSWCPD